MIIACDVTRRGSGLFVGAVSGITDKCRGAGPQRQQMQQPKFQGFFPRIPRAFDRSVLVAHLSSHSTTTPFLSTIAALSSSLTTTMPLWKEKKAATSKDQESMSQQRRTALAIVEALNRMDMRAVWHMRDRSCWREIYPKSLGMPAQDNDAAQRALNFMRNTFKSFYISVHEIIEDVNARKVCLWVICTGTTVSGPWTNEYVWSMEFNEAGTKVVRWKEFVDGISTKALFPEIMAEEWDESMSDRPSTGPSTRSSEAPSSRTSAGPSTDTSTS